MAPGAVRLAAAAALLAGLAACASPGLRPAGPAGRQRLARPSAAAPARTPTPSPSFPQQRPVDEDQPLRVRSKGLRYDHATDESVFYGGVTVTQDSTTLQARELRSQDRGQNAMALGGVLMTDPVRRFQARAGRAEYTGALRSAKLEDGLELVSVDPYGLSVTVTGRSGSFSDVSRWAQVEGGVRVRRGALTATAGSAQVLDGGQKVIMQGKVQARFGADQARADRVELDQADKGIELDGGVRARIVPQDLRRAMAAPWAPGGDVKEAQ
jgi:lipopolysaccharide export system protein LptA